ncbi:membrane protein [Treponema putidum]|nr:membrane protein [Treponema putidum]
MLLLCLFLGIFGIHRFYVGKYFTGILYALTMGLGYFGILFDLIMILMGKFTDSDGKIIS